MFAYCRGQSMVVHGRSSGSCGLCTPLQSKTIQNSRVLGYGRLNGHVASIVSMFSKRMFGKGIVPVRYGFLERELVSGKFWKDDLCTCEVRMRKSRRLFYKKFCKEKYSFFQGSFAKKNILSSNKSLPKPR